MKSKSCRACGGPLVEIAIVREESSMTMQSCSRCDARWWQEDGEHVDLPRVLSAVSPRR
jgi:uncharacterized Zn finger protein (UPF0148 family)